MAIKRLEIELLSDTTLGRGEGTAGEVDVEVEHDELGLPVAGGKLIRGLLRDEWLAMREVMRQGLEEAERRIFGQEGETLGERNILRIGDGVVGEAERAWFAWAVQGRESRITSRDVLLSLTEVRRQTSVERESGAPAETTLRATRVVIRGLKLHAPLNWLEEPRPEDLRCLALSALGVRHAGLGRHRGRGHVRLALEGDLKLTRRLAGLEG